MKVTKDIQYVGVNDHDIDLFEGQFELERGMAYNSYVILDEKIAVMDSVDLNFSKEWLSNIKEVLGSKKPDYLIVQHMEPDHSANITLLTSEYPDMVVVSSMQAFTMMKQFYGNDYADRRMVVKEGNTLELGKHTLQFIGAPMVHWPEVLMILVIKYYSLLMDLVNLEPMILKIKKDGLVKHVVIILELSENMEFRFKMY